MDHLTIRKLFKSFFTTNEHNHQWWSSASLIPHQDPSLLFVNAGMNPFKNIFLGIESAPNKNVITVQKCVRAGGKHNDLEQVGLSPFHHTFFEMMGNFSFGDYFKEDACYLAWTFLTKQVGLPKENLGVSVFEKDSETAMIWNQKLGIPKERIFFFGEADNFWRMGDQGPCGPCTEIHFDPNGFRTEKPQMFEVWNLVFMQYNEDQNGKKTPLKKKCIDTGMGLERLASLLQGESSNFHTDLFRPILKDIGHQTQKSYSYISSKEELANPRTAQTNFAFRVLADHIRASVFLIGDGVYPSNEGRGYVLRRILRRAIYYGRQLSENSSILSPTAKTVIKNYCPVYPELKEQQKNIELFLNQEEGKFLNTLDYGQEILEKELKSLKQSKSHTLPVEKTFQLYDTYGFPFDLIELICKKQNVNVDRYQFQQMMEDSKIKNRKVSAFSSRKKTYPQLDSKISPTSFVGYQQITSESRLMALFNENHQAVQKVEAPCKALAVFDSTCFYAEGGGQVSDQGQLVSKNKTKEAKEKAMIQDCQVMGGHYWHSIQLTHGTLKTGETYQLVVDKEKRKQTAIHHSATHLLHSALRKILGSQIKQAGSLVTAEKLRFDFTSPLAVTEEQCQKIEQLVNDHIDHSHAVHVAYKKYEQAIQDGALSFFEKPSVDKVRLLKMGDFSYELCGGTHVQNTKDIRLFKILSESAVGSGVRRIEAVGGAVAVHLVNQLAQENLNARKHLSLPFHSQSLLGEIEKQQNQIRSLKKSKSVSVKTPKITIDSVSVGDQKISVACWVHTSNQHHHLSAILDQMKKQNPSVVIVLTGDHTPSSIVVSVPKRMAQKIKAQKIIHGLGGKGGGPDSFAKGSLPNAVSLAELKKKVFDILQADLKK